MASTDQEGATTGSTTTSAGTHTGVKVMNTVVGDRDHRATGPTGSGRVGGVGRHRSWIVVVAAESHDAGVVVVVVVDVVDTV